MVCAVWLCVSFSARAQDAATLRVQILSGKTGRPVTNQHLLLQRPDGTPLVGKGANPSATTDGEGYAPIPNPDVSVDDVQIFVDMHRPCSKTGVHRFPLTKVRVAGVVSENSCKPRISMYPQPGTLIFYVRDLTFIEKMRR